MPDRIDAEYEITLSHGTAKGKLVVEPADGRRYTQLEFVPNPQILSPQDGKMVRAAQDALRIIAEQLNTLAALENG